MPEYVFTDREGEVYDISSDEELTDTQVKDIDMELNPARASDYFRGAASALSSFGYNVLETAHEVGNFIGGEISNVAYDDRGADVGNPWDDFKAQSKETYEGDVPQHVKERLSYKVTHGAAQLAGMMASGPVAPFTLASQGFSAGRDDYLETMGIDPNTATQDELEAARSVGAMIAIPTVVLEKIGLGKISKGLTSKLAPQVVGAATRRVAGMAAVEGITEGMEEGATNIIAKDILGYDPERERTRGMAEAATVGAIVGGIPGGVRYSPAIAVEGARGLVRAGEIGFNTGTNLAKSEAAKSMVDMTANGLVKLGDKAVDLEHKMAGALLEKGIDIEPIVKGGEFVAEKAKVGAKSAVEMVKYLPEMAHKGAKVWAKSEAGKTVDNFIQPLNDKVRGVNERIGQELVSFEHEHMKRYHDFMKMAERPIDAMTRMKKNNKEAYQKLHESLLAQDFAKAESIVVEEGGQESWNDIGSTLRFVYEQSAERGSGMGHIEQYYPSFVKDYKGLAKSLGHNLPNSAWEKALDTATKTKGKPLTSDETSALFEDLIRSKQPKGVEMGSPNSTRKRILDVDTRVENSKYYADPIESMVLYLNQTSDQITRMDYLGAMYDVVTAVEQDEVYSQEEVDYALQDFTPVAEPEVQTAVEPATPKPTTGQAIFKPEMRPGEKGAKPQKVRKLGAFGKAIQEEMEAGRLNDEQMDQLHDLLGSRFQRKTPMAGWIRGVKTATHIAFLGSPTTAITQLGDYAYTMHSNGINESLKAAGKSEWTLQDVFQVENDVAWEFSDENRVPDRLQKILDKTLTLTGMRAMDSKAKATFLTAKANRWRKILNGPDTSTKTELIQQIQARQGVEVAKQSIEDIKSKTKSGNVAELLLYELGQIAPMTQSDMPYMYNKNPNIRIFYALKSYTIKQMNYARNQSLAKIMSGDRKQIKEGFVNLLSLSSSLALANIPADLLKDFILGRDINLGLDDMFIDNLWRLLGLNSYTQTIIERDGAGSALEALAFKLPIFKVMDAVGQDAYHFAPPVISGRSETTKYFPVIGKLLDAWRD